MTAAVHALGYPGVVRRPRVDTVTVVPKPISRQAKARRVMFAVVAACVVVVSLATAQQVAAHGWQAFVFRAPGVGGSPPLPDKPQLSATSTAHSTVPQTVPAITPVSHHHHARRGGGLRHLARAFTGAGLAAGAPNAPTPGVGSVPAGGSRSAGSIGPGGTQSASSPVLPSVPTTQPTLPVSDPSSPPVSSPTSPPTDSAPASPPVAQDPDGDESPGPPRRPRPLRPPRPQRPPRPPGAAAAPAG